LLASYFEPCLSDNQPQGELIMDTLQWFASRCDRDQYRLDYFNAVADEFATDWNFLPLVGLVDQSDSTLDALIRRKLAMVRLAGKLATV
jgi:hypothetical protein